MPDQAQNLRDLMDEKSEPPDPGPGVATLPEDRQDPGETDPAEVIAVTSGKGGVGKSNLAVNLGIALSQAGHRVAVADMDLGLANVNVITNSSPRHNLMDVFEGRRELADILEEGPAGVQIIAGASGKEELANMRQKECQQFVERLGQLDRLVDTLIVDTSAGLSNNVMRFVGSADRTLLVTTPEPTAITDAYAIIKAGMRRRSNPHFNLVINRADSIMEAKRVAEKMQRVGHEFLDVPLRILGYMTEDDAVSRSVRSRRPFLLEYPNARVSQCVRHLQNRLTKDAELQEPGGVKSFFDGLFDWI